LKTAVSTHCVSKNCYDEVSVVRSKTATMSCRSIQNDELSVRTYPNNAPAVILDGGDAARSRVKRIGGSYNF